MKIVCSSGRFHYFICSISVHCVPTGWDLTPVVLILLVKCGSAVLSDSFSPVKHFSLKYLTPQPSKRTGLGEWGRGKSCWMAFMTGRSIIAADLTTLLKQSREGQHNCQLGFLGTAFIPALPMCSSEFTQTLFLYEKLFKPIIARAQQI